jgi:hypothetical protein
MARAAELAPHLLEGGDVGVIAVHIAQQRQQLVKPLGIEPAMRLDALACPLLQVVELPS